MKNGPKTVLSVAFPIGGLLSESTRADTPSTSERRINSWRSGVHVWPVRVRKLIVLIHSSEVRLRATMGHHESMGLVHGHGWTFFSLQGQPLRTINMTHFVSETNSWSLPMRFLKMNRTRLPSRALQCTEMEQHIDKIYARVWRKLCKLEYILSDNLWPVRVLKR